MQGVWAAARSEEGATQPKSPSDRPSPARDIRTCTELGIPFPYTPKVNPVACFHLGESAAIGKKLYTCQASFGKEEKDLSALEREKGDEPGAGQKVGVTGKVRGGALGPGVHMRAEGLSSPFARAGESMQKWV